MSFFQIIAEALAGLGVPLPEKADRPAVWIALIAILVVLVSVAAWRFGFG